MVADSTKEPAAPLGAPFWRLFTSSALSNLSDGVGTAALPLLAVSLTRDPVAISALTAVAFLPWLLLAIPAGALAYDGQPPDHAAMEAAFAAACS